MLPTGRSDERQAQSGCAAICAHAARGGLPAAAGAAPRRPARPATATTAVRLSARLHAKREQVRVDLLDGTGQLIGQQNLMRQEGQTDLYTASWTADRAGKYSVKLGSASALAQAKKGNL